MILSETIWRVTMTNVWYVGNYGKCQLSVSDWATLGAVVSEPTEWNLENGWSLPESQFSSKQLTILAGMDKFLTGQTGPRIKSSIPILPSSGAPYSEYYAKTKELYEQFILSSFKYDLLKKFLPELFSDFSSLLNGNAPIKFDTGQPASTFKFASSPSNNIQVINDGSLYVDWSGSGSAAGYFKGKLAGNVKNIGQRFRFKPNATGSPTTNGVAAMAICRTAIDDSGPPTMALHFTVSANAVIIGVWNGPDEPGTDGLTQLVDHSFSYPLKIDDRSKYEMEAWIDDSVFPARCRWEIRSAGKKRIIVADEFTDSRLSSFSGQYVFFENYALTAATDNYVKIDQVWADSKSAHGPNQEYEHWVVGSKSPTQSNVNFTVGVPIAISPAFNFVAPPSGSVKISMGCFISKPTNSTIMFSADAAILTPGATAGSYADYVPSNIDNSTQGRHEVNGIIAGLTPGARYQLNPYVWANKTDTVLIRNTAGFNAFCTVEPMAGSK